MPPALPLILAVLAVYRIGRMVPTGEEGPFGITEKVYDWAADNQGRHLARGLLCYYCTTFWLALLPAIAFGAASWWEFILIWLGIAGGAAAIYKQAG